VFSSVSVVPDHIVHHVRLTADELVVELAAPAVPPPAAPRETVPTRVTAASATAILELKCLFQPGRRERLWLVRPGA
jgi:hypothetical protein